MIGHGLLLALGLHHCTKAAGCVIAAKGAATAGAAAVGTKHAIAAKTVAAAGAKHAAVGKTVAVASGAHAGQAAFATKVAAATAPAIIG